MFCGVQAVQLYDRLIPDLQEVVLSGEGALNSCSLSRDLITAALQQPPFLHCGANVEAVLAG